MPIYQVEYFQLITNVLEDEIEADTYEEALEIAKANCKEGVDFRDGDTIFGEDEFRIILD